MCIMSEQTKKINLSDLRYKKLRKVIGEVEIYNPDQQLKNEIEKEMIKRITEAEVDNVANVSVGMGEMVTTYIPLLTNIKYDLDDVFMIQEIIADPSPQLEEIIDEISDILSKIFERASRIVTKLIKAGNGVMYNPDLTIEEKEQVLKEMQYLQDNSNYEDVLITDEELGE